MRHFRGILVTLIVFALLSMTARRAAAQKGLYQGIDSLAAAILEKVTQEQKHRVAVLPFHEMTGRTSVLDSYLSEALLTELVRAGKVEVIERAMLDRLLGEIKLGQTGIIDSETARRVGKVAGVDAIVTGTITELRTYLAVNCRLIDTQTGQVFAAAQTWINKDSDVMALLNQRDSGGAEPATAEREPSKKTVPIAPPPLPQAVIERDCIFQLKGCTLFGSTLKCDILITDKGVDRTLIFGKNDRTRIIDDSGREYRGISFSIGSHSNDYAARGSLTTDVPIRGQLQFGGLSAAVRKLSLLEFHYTMDYNHGIYSGVIRFTNIAL